MTKKEYMKPTMDVVKIKGCALLTASPTMPVVDGTTITSDDMLAPPFMSAPSLEGELDLFSSFPL